MCTLQIYAQNGTGQPGAYRKGDLVAVYEDGICKEPPAPGSPLVFVHLPGEPASEFQQYLEPDEEEQTDGDVDENGELIIKRVMKARRAFGMSEAGVSAEALANLQSKREHVNKRTKEAVKSLFVDRRVR